MGYLEYAVLALLGIVLILLFLSRNRAIFAKKEAERKLEKTMGDLEALYSEINNAQEELNVKYREIKSSDEKIKKLAYEDSLTGMPNRSAFREMLLHTLETLRKNEILGIMYLDLDHFKRFDDLWGHSNGDELILDVSHRLMQNLDEDDYIARMDGDGDGFMILSQNLSGETSFDEKIKRLIGAFRFPFMASFGEAVITISIGATMAPADGEKVEVLLKNASLALAEAKKMGKDTYVYYSEELKEREIENIELKSSLSMAIKNNDFLIKYEPIMDLLEKKTNILRLRLFFDRKDKGLTPAARFIHIVESMGFSDKIGTDSLTRIAEDMKFFPDKRIIIPLTEKMLFHPTFVRKFVKIIEDYQIEKSKILIEIEEKVLFRGFSDCLFVIEGFKEMGFGFLVENFGGGGASLEVLRDMKPDFISVSIKRIFYDRSEEEARAYLALLLRTAEEFGSEVIITNLTTRGEEEEVLRCKARLASGEIYGTYIAAEELHFEDFS